MKDFEKLKETCPCPIFLDFKFPKEVEQGFAPAQDHWNKYSGDLDYTLLRTSTIDIAWLKSAKLSADAFVQMVIQLAYFKLYQKNCPTYETGQTRMFLHGRTETVRTTSVDSVAFCQGLSHSNASKEDKIKLLTKAVDSHKKYMADACFGKGCDRHLLGLKIMALESGIDLPSIFTDPAFAISTKFQLSTSNVTFASTQGATGGFGPLVGDGYGICYQTRKDQLVFSITCKHSCPDTDVKKMRKALEASLLDIKALYPNFARL